MNIVSPSVLLEEDKGEKGINTPWDILVAVKLAILKMDVALTKHVLDIDPIIEQDRSIKTTANTFEIL